MPFLNWILSLIKQQTIIESECATRTIVELLLLFMFIFIIYNYNQFIVLILLSVYLANQSVSCFNLKLH